LITDLCHARDWLRQLEGSANGANGNKCRLPERLADLARKTIIQEKSMIEPALAKLDHIIQAC
jgi:IS1 family transposase